MYRLGRRGSNGRRPLIGLTVGTVRAGDGLDYARVRMSYIQAIEAAGGLPVPVLADPAALVALLERLDGLLLPGGADIDPAAYGEPMQGAQPPQPGP